MAKEKNTVSVLAFEKKLVPSDGFLYGTTWENRNSVAIPLKLQEKSVRGTISNRLKKDLKSDPLKLDAEVEKPNLQTVDYCTLGVEQDTLKMTFTLKVLSGVEKPSACNNAEFSKNYSSAAKKYIKENGFSELGQRYAQNIANARFFWRNRVGAENVEVQVTSTHFSEKLVFNALKFSLRDFHSENKDLKKLGEKIAEALSGKVSHLFLTINTYAQIGQAQEVYPSEELVLDDKSAAGKGKKSKILYQNNDIAGLHSQKIGNALRCIDTWYPDFDDVETGPIAVEPYGAVTNLGVAYRNPKNKSDFYTLFDNHFVPGEDMNKEESHYIMAVLVRGGVFGESSKD